MNIDQVRIVSLPKILDERGNLSFFENNNQIPFAMKRVYWIYDVPGGESRGGHAYRELTEIIIALSGSFELVINDGKNERRVSLNRSYNAVVVPKLIWRKLENFSTNALALIACDYPYDENQYIRDFELFKAIVDE